MIALALYNTARPHIRMKNDTNVSDRASELIRQRSRTSVRGASPARADTGATAVITVRRDV
jgi:hypothetical protein